ncbi:hypothetical protein [Geothrix sp. 21YS21S-4]|uniref:hypothetical protein n=1 Tax=Geothrix sp. 21YS21S-4 TaxID=3068889 RepID=UPI0027BA178D|nr:hypothetical protein [Geothrix sp. 21YS21S-4]
MRAILTMSLVAAATLACNNKSGAPVVAAPTQGQSAPAAGPVIAGKLLERIEASPYSYLKLQTPQGEIWAAVPETKLEKGADVTIANPMLMRDFESKTMKRTFAEIYFGTLAPAGGAPAAAPAPMAGGMDAAPAGMGNANPHGQAGQTAPVEVGKVEKAAGADARTVAELWAQKTGLKEKTVTVRGKVVKYNAGVMGRNWIHLQDGTGDAAKGTHDITFTSADQVAKGDTVTLRGTLRLDKDFGAGYTYAAIVEDAKVVKK